MSKGKYYYTIYYHECPICGRGKEYRERVYGKKPKDGSQYHYTLTYDYCDQ